MHPNITRLAAIAFALSPVLVAAGDYVGLLRPTSKPAAIAIPETGFYWPQAGPFGSGLGAAPAPEPESFRMKLGFRYSRYFAVETGYADFGPVALRAPFALARAPGRGFSLDTVGTLPLWSHVALYGRIGAWRTVGGASLLAAGTETLPRPGAGLRYGLGLKVDLTRRFGLMAEMERFSPLDRWGPREPDSDQVTLGVTWRF